MLDYLSHRSSSHERESAQLIDSGPNLFYSDSSLSLVSAILGCLRLEMSSNHDLGLILFRFPIEGSLKGWFIAFVAGNSISGFAAVSTLDKEMLMKGGSYWEAQIWMYC